MDQRIISRWGLLLLVSLLSACASQPRGDRPRVDTPPPVEQRQPAPEVSVPPPVRATPAQPRATLPREEGTLPPAAEQAPGAAPQPPTSSTPPPVGGRVEPMPPAARNLAAKAEAASRIGRHDEAAAYLERALRIAPRSPELWQNLAVVRFRQKDYAKVEGLAQRSNALAPSSSPLRKTNWELIAAARKARGDAKGAAEAAAEARRFGS